MSKGKLTAAGNSMLEAKRTLGRYVETQKSIGRRRTFGDFKRTWRKAYMTTSKVAASCEASTPFSDHLKKVAW